MVMLQIMMVVMVMLMLMVMVMMMVMMTLQSSPRVAVEEEEEGNTLVVRGVTQLDEVLIPIILTVNQKSYIYNLYISSCRLLTPALCRLLRRPRSNIPSQSEVMARIMAMMMTMMVMMKTMMMMMICEWRIADLWYQLGLRWKPEA